MTKMMILMTCLLHLMQFMMITLVLECFKLTWIASFSILKSIVCFIMSLNTKAIRVVEVTKVRRRKANEIN